MTPDHCQKKQKSKDKKQKEERTLNEALCQVESENSDKEEDMECAAIKCIISTLENVVIEWVSCESCRMLPVVSLKVHSHAI